MRDIDPAFIQAPEHRPKLKFIETDDIPVINLSNDHEKVVQEIGNACQNWGFFQVVNHGVAPELHARIQKVAKDFFNLPIEEKKLVKRDEVNSMGYHDSEHTKNVRDWKEVFDFLLNDPTFIPASHEPDDDKELRELKNQWPTYSSVFRETCETYVGEMEKLAFKLLELISLSLGLPADRLNSYFEKQTSFLRLNYYRPCPFPELALGIGRHKDSGAITVLAQNDVCGLEVKRKSDGEWISVNPEPDAFIINVGDVVQVWTNDRYESVEHRVVVNSKKERFSLPFFFFPSHYVMVKPLEELIDEQNPPKYREYRWGKFMASRNRSDYQKLKGMDESVRGMQKSWTGSGSEAKVGIKE